MGRLFLPLSLLVAAAGLAALPGCGGGREKELPKTVSAGDDTPAVPAAVVPEKSETAAVAVVERAVKIATDGNPERLNKAKVNAVGLKGVVTHPGGARATVRRVEGVWPDRLALTDEFNEGGPTKVMMRLRRPVLAIAKRQEGQTAPVDFGDMKAFEAAFAADAVGRHWLAVLVPLTDPKTVVFDARKEVVNGQAADILKCSVPGCPVFTLFFDQKTGYLGRVDFAHLEPGRPTPTQKFFAFNDHRPFAGVVAPARIEYRENAIRLEEWTVDGWEFPDRLDDAGFDAPR